MGARPLVADLDLDLARLLARCDPAGSRRAAAQALELASELGMRGVEAAAREALDRLPGPAAPAALSRRQLECVRGVASGLSSKEIAEQLGLSPKTVDLHLTLAMRKLDAGSRAQAAARAIALGLVDEL